MIYTLVRRATAKLSFPADRTYGNLFATRKGPLQDKKLKYSLRSFATGVELD